MLVHKPCQPGQTINEEWPVEPKWDYPSFQSAYGKAHRRHARKIPAVILRIAGVYDDHCHSIPISNQIQRIYEKQWESHLFSGDITHGASFIHMDDLVDAIALAVEKRKTLPPELTMLLGEPVTLSYDQLQREISRLIDGKEIATYRVPKIIAMAGSSGPMPYSRSAAPLHQTVDDPARRRPLCAGYWPRQEIPRLGAEADPAANASHHDQRVKK